MLGRNVVVGLMLLSALMASYAQAELQLRSPTADAPAARPASEPPTVKAKPVEEMKLEEIAKELEKLTEDLKDLEGEWGQKYIFSKWEMWFNGGALGFIWGAHNLLGIRVQSRDLTDQIAERDRQEAALKTFLSQNSQLLDELHEKVRQTREFINVSDRQVGELVDFAKQAHPNDRELHERARLAAADWRGENLRKRRSRTLLDTLIKDPRMQAPALKQWHEAFEYIDMELVDHSFNVYEADRKITDKMKEKLPFVTTRPLQEITRSSTVTPDRFPYEIPHTNRSVFGPRTQNNINLAEIGVRHAKICKDTLHKLGSERSNRSWVRRTLYTPFALQAGFVTLGIHSKARTEEHTARVNEMKERRKLLEEAKKKKDSRVEEASKDLLAELTEALREGEKARKERKTLKGEAKALVQINDITGEVMERYKNRLHSALKKAYEHEEEWPIRSARLKSAIEKLDVENISMAMPYALRDAIHLQQSKAFQLPQVVAFIGTTDKNVRDTELNNLLYTYYANLIDRHFVRIDPGKKVSARVSAFLIEQMVQDTFHRMEGRQFTPFDPGTVAPAPVLPNVPAPKGTSQAPAQPGSGAGNVSSLTAPGADRTGEIASASSSSPSLAVTVPGLTNGGK